MKGSYARRTALLLCLSALSLSGCTLWSASKKVNWTSATGTEQYERMLWQAIQKKDWLTVESHLASTFVSNGPDGARNKEETLARLRQLEITDFSMGDVQVSPAGVDSVLTYTLLVKGNTSPAPRRVLSLWQEQKKGGWILAAWSQSPADTSPNTQPK